MNYEILVNKDNPIDIEYLNNVIIPSLEEVTFIRDNDDIFEEFKITEKKIYLEKETKKAFCELRSFLNNMGIEFDICSGYLSLENQKNKYDSFLERNGEELTKIRISKPGCSEHHTGLALDCDFYKNGNWAGICPLEDGSENEETKYIHSILSNFGFILRYPKEKTNITKMQYEPWHIRYVGIELAKKLFFENKTLEEYHKELEEQRNQITK